MLWFLLCALAAPLVASCADGDIDACVVLVKQGDPRGTEGIVAAHREECDAGSAWSCDQLGIWSADPAEQRRAQAAACEGGMGESCYGNGLRALADGDIASAIATFERGCRHNNAESCDAAQRYGQLEARVAQQPCDAFHPESCFARGMAVVALASEIPKASFDRAALAFQTGCIAGHAPSCTQLGVLAQRGRGVPLDPARAAVLFGGSCRAADWSACTRLAELATHGVGVPADPERAEALRTTACDADYGPACYFLGNQLEGTPERSVEAAAAWARACHLGVPEACR